MSVLRSYSHDADKAFGHSERVVRADARLLKHLRMIRSKFSWVLILLLALAGCENEQRPSDNDVEAIATGVARNVTADHPRVEALYGRMRALEDRVTQLEKDNEPRASVQAPAPSPARYELIIEGQDGGRRYPTSSQCEAAKRAILDQQAEQCRLTICNQPDVLCVPL